ncbi:MAG TPA: thioredoxin family protein [Candidatus Avacidaminococcus intestinavium]|uniref:Thioredoxin family protein n=1 Tax=Candidatus Avacidaminococcus intestinavium TaxID=2840684 RepID=A0A9D1MQ49_9FIRM|nr:thioredoxin family protein [Candidatus Avacidaminococcus intestinavium]
MHIKVLGPMTKSFDLLLQNTAIAAKKLKCNAKFEKVNDFTKVITYGVMALPALVIDERVVAYGSVLKVEEIMQIIQQLNN